jgi:alkanesulfonate monooxygenase SsuD/methylene tetrahydromethanopterin reductase-like flavin-dependent oxidoreductase (luciferase family)
MEFGLVLGPFFPPREEMTSKDAVALQLRFAERAAESGFEYVSMGHHYLSGPLAQFFQPIPLAAAILTNYPSVSVATTIFLLPYHNPVEMAELVATLDALSPGRLVLGVGAGYRRAEAEAAGITNSSRKERLAESISAMRLLWRGGPCSFEGRHYRFHDADIGISTADPDGPPILIGADTIETVGSIPSLGGDHWIANPRNSVTFIRNALPVYREALAADGREFEGIPLLRNVYLSNDEEAAKRTLGQAVQRMAAIQASWGQPGERARPSLDELRREKQIILGNAEQIAESLVELNRDVGAECVFLTCYLPGMDPEESLDMVIALGEDVLPLVRREAGTRSLFAGR